MHIGAFLVCPGVKTKALLPAMSGGSASGRALLGDVATRALPQLASFFSISLASALLSGIVLTFQETPLSTVRCLAEGLLVQRDRSQRSQAF